MKHIRKFSNNTELYSEYYNNPDITEETPWLSYVNSGTYPVQYTKSYNEMPLTVEALEDGYMDIIYEGQSDDYAREIGYSKNHGTWYWNVVDTRNLRISFVEGDIIQLKGNSYHYFYTDESSYDYFTHFKFDNGDVKIYGNIMSLCYPNTFSDKTALSEPRAFQYLFSNSTALVDAENLIIPATSLTQYCYLYMFTECTNLIHPPKILPAVTLKKYCYQNMFSACSSMISAPELPATQLEDNCYCAMFSGCSSLEMAPELPATDLYNDCYRHMFAECTSLKDIPRLPATTLDQECYYGMFSECTGLTDVDISVSDASLRSMSMAYMFSGCSNLTSCVIRSGSIYGSYTNVFMSMFRDCPKLKYIKCLITSGTISVQQTLNWITGASSSGKFVHSSGADWSAVISDMSGWEIITI